MQESYGEGVASHTGPESCVAARKDGDEALTGVRAGRPLSREIEDPSRGGHFGVPTHVTRCGRPHLRRRYREMVGDPAHARKHPARESGEPGVVCAGRECRPHREAQGRTPMIHDTRQSYSPIVPKKPPSRTRPRKREGPDRQAERPPDGLYEVLGPRAPRSNENAAVAGEPAAKAALRGPGQARSRVDGLRTERARGPREFTASRSPAEV